MVPYYGSFMGCMFGQPGKSNLLGGDKNFSYKNFFSKFKLKLNIIVQDIVSKKTKAGDSHEIL